jgi:hypothetical protein
MNRRALDKNEKILGTEYLDILNNVNNLVLMFRYQGKYKKIEKMNRLTLEKYEKILGAEYSNILINVGNLISVF